MEEFGFILEETFCSQGEEQRKKQFQKEFERYAVDSVLRMPAEMACDREDGLRT